VLGGDPSWGKTKWVGVLLAPVEVEIVDTGVSSGVRRGNGSGHGLIGMRDGPIQPGST
jgi:hypothetical protein